MIFARILRDPDLATTYFFVCSYEEPAGRRLHAVVFAAILCPCLSGTTFGEDVVERHKRDGFMLHERVSEASGIDFLAQDIFLTFRPLRLQR
jgi:hypothetical protein